MAETNDSRAGDEATGAERYRHLPDPVRLEDTVATKETSPVPDPDGGRDPERDFMLRNAG